MDAISYRVSCFSAEVWRAEVRWIKGIGNMAQDESTQRGWDVGKMHDVMYSKLAEARRNGIAGCLFTCHVKTRNV